MRENKIENKIEKLFAQLELPVKNISFINKGVGSQFYKIVTSDNVYGIKIAMYPERSKKVKKEAMIRQELIDKGLQFIPKPVCLDEKLFTNSAVIYEFIEGEPPDFSNKIYLAILAEELAELHTIDIKIISDGFSLVLKNFKS
ncbi:MAG: hypothetical protein ACFFBD_15410, partial [Candidatus Hodarchaeota archaeon]